MLLLRRIEVLLVKANRLGLLQHVYVALRGLVAEHEARLKAGAGSGLKRRTVRGFKAKGREGVLLARQWILAQFPHLEADDILIQTTSVGGSDLHFSPRAGACFPFAPESKRVEALNIWAALHQAEVNAGKKGRKPVLFFSRAHSPLYIAFRADDLPAFLRSPHDANGEGPQ